ncbi:uncharacterized protein BO97DRAFT_403551 [Aspergillus homomorphus CBS 101889]|uniref:Uncharacterized protein n=1 Tax=Aspergillus homomorphus (strain CBS 101889) TaxID=1450537 RepID=A0A395I5T9_ASPHC|nr:hypothetical protein BO97DRAFT_403551 [Aspergillus homomorphus CBS 101889]RAL15581.1 hypothetical protein BO97DRAFT_403551 [Aspergillus homomorphus CBS 101889]
MWRADWVLLCLCLTTSCLWHYNVALQHLNGSSRINYRPSSSRHWVWPSTKRRKKL